MNPTTDKRNSQRGFTLVELAIVLVVIGVLIGAVLQGQALVESAQLKTTVAQMDASRAAVTTFQDRFRGLPGDFNAGPRLGLTAALDGNGDGTIGNAGTDADITVGNPPNLNNENALFWTHLVATGLVQGPTPMGSGGTPNFGAASAYLRTKLSNFSVAPVHDADNRLWLAVAETYTSGAISGGPSGALAQEIDIKYDDGNPNNGTIRPQDACLDGTAYDPDTSCILYFRAMN